MARHNDREGIAPRAAPGGSNGPRMPRPLGQFAVGQRFAKWNPRDLLPNPMLKRSPNHSHRHGERLSFAFEILRQFRHRLANHPMAFARLPMRRPLRHMLAAQKIKPHQRRLIRHQHQFADLRFQDRGIVARASNISLFLHELTIPVPSLERHRKCGRSLKAGAIKSG